MWSSRVGRLTYIAGRNVIGRVRIQSGPKKCISKGFYSELLYHDKLAKPVCVLQPGRRVFRRYDSKLCFGMLGLLGKDGLLEGSEDRDLTAKLELCLVEICSLHQAAAC